LTEGFVVVAYVIRGGGGRLNLAESRFLSLPVTTVTIITGYCIAPQTRRHVLANAIQIGSIGELKGNIDSIRQVEFQERLWVGSR
jgi:hypothetical protein